MRNKAANRRKLVMTPAPTGLIDLNVLEHQLANEPKWTRVRQNIRQLRTINAAVTDFQQVRHNLNFLTSFWQNADLAAPLLQHSVLLYARATSNGNDGLSGWNFQAGLSSATLKSFHEEIHFLRDKWIAHYGSYYPETPEPFLDDRIVAVFAEDGSLSVWGPWTRNGSVAVVARKLATLCATLGEFGNKEREQKSLQLVNFIKDTPELLQLIGDRAASLRFEPLRFYRTEEQQIATWPPGPPHQPFARVSLV
ncbi:hypothetical protein [Bradyrhizobium sp. I71]|uniref:hypothetical protein n=1 Tax=Bradyrhizobium sp. I71 TaxID=2590772 RepID=UPI001EF86DC4|nr:hypothetical protein [Bradyrhizobium sp. I71]ULL01237.1 hypothetical protein FJV43_16440 [Bradyrhizobium sp. I71]